MSKIAKRNFGNAVWTLGKKTETKRQVAMPVAEANGEKKGNNEEKDRKETQNPEIKEEGKGRLESENTWRCFGQLMGLVVDLIWVGSNGFRTNHSGKKRRRRA